MKLLLKTPVLFLLLLLAVSCDSGDPEEARIAGQFSGTISFTSSQTAGQQVISLVLAETEGIVSGSGILAITLDERNYRGVGTKVIMYNFTVMGTITGPDFSLRWYYSHTLIADTYEGHIDIAGNLSGVFRRELRRDTYTAENVLLQRE